MYQLPNNEGHGRSMPVGVREGETLRGSYQEGLMGKTELESYLKSRSRTTQGMSDGKKIPSQ